MVREISAGGVVVRHKDGEWWMAAIVLPGEPVASEAKDSATGESEVNARHSEGGGARAIKTSATKPRATKKPVLCLPKGLVDPGEKALDAALREVREETGITAEVVTKLADIKYVYVRSWGDGERVFKIVTFYLLKYAAGRINEISDDMRIEVAEAKWIRLEEAPKLLAYRGEKEMARKALQYLKEHSEL